MERIKKSLILTVVMNLAFFIHPVYATSEAAVPQADVQLQQVALFKNGLGFFVSEVTVPEKQDSFRIVPFAAASHGTFWVSYPPKVKLESLIAKEIESEELVEAVTIPELLRANVGRKVSLTFDDKQIVGVIKHFAEQRQRPTPSPYAPGRPEQTPVGYRGYTSRDLTPSRLMIIETEQAEVAIDPQNVRKIEFLGGKMKRSFEQKKKVVELQVRLSGRVPRKALTERGRPGVMGQVMYQAGGIAGGIGGYGGAAPVMPEYGAAEAGKVAEDLFLYPVENVHLKKGQVGYLPLFTESVPYKHIYQWKIPDYVNEEERYSYDRRREQEREPDEEVWHCLRMENTTKVPWTTAPAETVKEGLILGQDTLKYTPAQGETTLRITRAMSVKAEQLELETERKRDAAQLYGYHYDLITVEGKLSVTNFQPKAITLEITKTLSGEVKSSQPKAKIETLARGLRRMNAVKKLTWTIKLKPGEHKQLGYIYDVYVRR